ncbi:MAG: hypothetical protein U0K80_09480 [Methanobrevibacter sp.]|nr:hypothetical protein [Methanobrevibacter sp.]
MNKVAVDILMGITIILEFLSLPILLHQILGIGLIFLVILHIKLIELPRLVEVVDSWNI